MSGLTKLVSSLAVLALLAAGAAPAQQQAQDEATQRLAEQQNWPVKIFEIKQANSGDLWTLLFNVFRGQITGSTRAPQLLVVRAPKELMPAIEDIVKRFDAPPAPVKNIDLTAYMVVAERAESNAKLPAELEPVVKQLKGVFPNYQGFRLLDTLVLRSRAGAQAMVRGVAPAAEPDGTGGIGYDLEFRSVRITSDEKGRTIWIDGLRFGTRVPVYSGPDKKLFNYENVGVSADVDLREGQKAVVGKAGIPGSDRTLFLVLTAKVVD